MIDRILFRTYFKGFVQAFKGKSPNHDFFWRCSSKTQKINTLHLQKCGHFCLKDLKCQDSNKPSTTGCFLISHMSCKALSPQQGLHQFLSPERELWAGSALGLSFRLQCPADTKCERRIPKWWICACLRCVHVLCKTPPLLQRLPQSPGWALIAASSHLCSHIQAKGMWNVLWLGK